MTLPAEHDARPRRLLLVSYHFGAVGPTGGFRWAATVEALREAGWDVDVVTAAEAPATSGAAGGPGGLDVHSIAPSTGPRRVKQALLGALRRILPSESDGSETQPAGAEDVNPDALFVWTPGYRRSLRERVLHGLDALERAVAETLWSLRAARRGRSLLRRHRYRAVVVSSPPHYTQLAGPLLVRGSRLPYVADYRDPWVAGLGVHADYLSDPERWLGGRTERRLLRRAHTVVHNTEWAREAAAAEVTFPADHVAIPNGYDDAGPIEEPDAQCFRVVYTGHLYPFMDVRPLFAACARLGKRRGLDPERFRIDFVGTEERFEGVALRDLASAYGLGDVFHHHPRVPRERAARFQQAAAVLVAYDWLFPVAVVSKFYEYARMKSSMLLLGNERGALADAAARLGSRVVEPSDTERIDAALDAAFERWQQGDWHTLDAEGRFDRRHQSRRLVALLEAL